MLLCSTRILPRIFPENRNRSDGTSNEVDTGSVKGCNQQNKPIALRLASPPANGNPKCNLSFLCALYVICLLCIRYTACTCRNKSEQMLSDSAQLTLTRHSKSNELLQDAATHKQIACVPGCGHSFDSGSAHVHFQSLHFRFKLIVRLLRLSPHCLSAWSRVHVVWYGVI